MIVTTTLLSWMRWDPRTWWTAALSILLGIVLVILALTWAAGWYTVIGCWFAIKLTLYCCMWMLALPVMLAARF